MGNLVVAVPFFHHSLCTRIDVFMVSSYSNCSEVFLMSVEGLQLEARLKQLQRDDPIAWQVSKDGGVEDMEQSIRPCIKYIQVS